MQINHVIAISDISDDNNYECYNNNNNDEIIKLLKKMQIQ